MISRTQNTERNSSTTKRKRKTNLSCRRRDPGGALGEGDFPRDHFCATTPCAREQRTAAFLHRRHARARITLRTEECHGVRVDIDGFVVVAAPEDLLSRQLRQARRAQAGVGGSAPVL